MNALNSIKALNSPPAALQKGEAAHRLSIYLNDHFAGSTGGLELASRLASSNRDSDFAPTLEMICHEIAEDKQVLEDLMSTLDVRKDRFKQAGSWLVEKIGRAKLNGQVLGYSPLSRLIELETLTLGVRGKQALWASLARTVAGDPQLERFDFQELERRAKSQQKRLEMIRLQAAVVAFDSE